MIELEKRIIIDTKEYTKLLNKFRNSLAFVKEFKRFTMVKVNRPDFVADETDFADLKIRTTGEKGTVVLKYGNWKVDMGREENEFEFKTSAIKDVIGVFKNLGNYYWCVTYIFRTQFAFSNLTITIDKHPFLQKHVVEIEAMIKNEDEAVSAEKVIKEFLDSYKLQVTNFDEFFTFVQSMNNNVNLQVDFSKTTVSDWYKKWEPYVWCKI